MLYKLSAFNVIIEKFRDKGVLMFNTRTTSLGVMAFENYELFMQQKNIDLESNVIPIEHLKIMEKNGFIVESNKDEFKEIEVICRITRDFSSSFGITIAPTMACNMACLYCYEEGADKPGAMQADVQQSLIKFINQMLEMRPKGGHFSVTWYGGEPLLALETIRKLSAEFKSLANSRNFTYKAGIVTNGVLFTKSVSHILADECAVNFAQITLDGFQTTHDSRRPQRNSESSFDTIVSNILDAPEAIHVSIRSNCDKNNSDEIHELHKWFRTKYPDYSSRVSLYPAPISSKHEISQNPSLFANEDFAQTVLKKELDTRPVEEKGKKNNLYPHTQNGPCGAVGMNFYVIDPLGDLYKCWDLIGRKEEVVGNVAGTINWNAALLRWLEYDLPQKCKTCELVPICQGGCPYHRMVLGETAQCYNRVYILNDIMTKIAHQNLAQNASHTSQERQ